MKKIFLLLIFCSSLSAQWEQQYSGYPNTLHGVAFYNDTLGIAVGEQGRILKSQDGGYFWYNVNLTIGTFYSCVRFATPNLIFAMGYLGSIIKSTNYGETWVVQNSPTTMQINGLSFYDQNNAYATGYAGILLKTTNAGNNWTYSWLSNTMLDIHMFNATTGIVCGSGGYIFKTTNGGTSWVQRFTTVNFDLQSMAFLNATTGVMVGNGGTIMTTVNGGNTWKLQDSMHTTTNTLFRVAYPSANRITAVGGGGVIITSSNGGINWVQQESGTTYNLYGIHFRDENHGCVVGECGIILTTTDGGALSVNTISTGIPGKYSLSQNYPNPFNPSTNIKYQIINNKLVTLKIYDILGKEIATLINEKQTPGYYEINWDASGYPSGIYFYRLTTGDFSETKKMFLIK
jgi:photosystem II stability/assembly factor-like uncharacterized protein